MFLIQLKKQIIIIIFIITVIIVIIIIIIVIIISLYFTLTFNNFYKMQRQLTSTKQTHK